MASTDRFAPPAIVVPDAFSSFRTSAEQLHFVESPLHEHPSSGGTRLASARIVVDAPVPQEPHWLNGYSLPSQSNWKIAVPSAVPGAETRR